MPCNAHKPSVSAGFTLLEIAVVFVIVGLLTAMMFQSQQVGTSNTDCVAQTRSELRTIQAALDHFVQLKQRYPAPTARNLGSTRTSYGHEDLTFSTTDALNNANPIVFGSLPFATLGLPSTYANDCWGNQYSYFVTQSLTTTLGYAEDTRIGGITLMTGTRATPKLVDAHVAYAVISHGPNGNKRGAVKPNYMGANHRWCAGDTSIDSENCDIGNEVIFTNDYMQGGEDGENSFDDLLVTSDKTLPILPESP